MTEYLDPEDILDWVERRGLHVRERPLFLSAMASPMPVFGEEVYPDLHVKGAVLLAALNRNHALFDGNKRLSWVTSVAFFEINGVDIVVDNQADIDEFVRQVAAGGMPLEDIAEWLRAHAHPLDQAKAEAVAS